MKTIKTFLEIGTEGSQDFEEKVLFFDIHGTLMQPRHSALSEYNRKKYYFVLQKLSSTLSQEEKDVAVALAFHAEQLDLVEKEVLSHLLNLSEKGYKTFACTSSLTGKVGQHSLMEEKLFSELKRFEIDLSSSLPFSSGFRLESLPSYRGNFPVYYKGILFANKLNKADVIFAFLKEAKIFPKKVILVDNSKKKLVDAEKSWKNEKIEFVPILYQAHVERDETQISEEEFCAFWERWIRSAKSL